MAHIKLTKKSKEDWEYMIVGALKNAIHSRIPQVNTTWEYLEDEELEENIEHLEFLNSLFTFMEDEIYLDKNDIEIIRKYK